MKYFLYLPKKNIFLFILSRGITFFLAISLNVTCLSVFIGYNVGCKHSLRLENGLLCHFHERINRNLPLEAAAGIMLHAS